MESLHDAMRFCRLRGKYQLSYMLGKQALTQPTPQEGLFIEHWIYEYGIRDEFSIAAYWAGYYQDALNACLILWNTANLPDAYRPRIRENARFVMDKLCKDWEDLFILPPRDS